MGGMKGSKTVIGAPVGAKGGGWAAPKGGGGKKGPMPAGPVGVLKPMFLKQAAPAKGAGWANVSPMASKGKAPMAKGGFANAGGLGKGSYAPAPAKGGYGAAPKGYGDGKGGFGKGFDKGGFGKGGFGKDGKGKGKGKKQSRPAPADDDPFWEQKQAAENRVVAEEGAFYTGTVSVYNAKHAWGFIVVDDPASLPEDAQAAMAAQAQQAAARGKESQEQLYFRRPDLSPGYVPEKGAAVMFQLYTDDKGVGACQVTGM